MRPSPSTIESASGYYSRRLNRTEQLWVIFDLELLSIVMALKHWYGLLKHAEVIVYTDSLSARYIATSDKQTSSRRAKLVSNLALFDNLMIVHIPGNKNVVADFLPRVYESIRSDNDDPNTLKKRKLKAVKEKHRVEMLLQQDPKTISQSTRRKVVGNPPVKSNRLLIPLCLQLVQNSPRLACHHMKGR